MTNLKKVGLWLKAFRLQTLPLASSCALMGSFVAAYDGTFRWNVFFLTILTITSLQILSNLANDYGDAVSGVDGNDRVGFLRVTQSNLISKTEMKRMILVFVILSVLFGSSLIIVALGSLGWKIIGLFYLLGLAAIVAAIKYTMGKKPYGYVGLGDLFVFLFFGLLGVIGSYFLQTLSFDIQIVIPSVIVGLLSVGVLNINNLRDMEQDRGSGKRTLPVRFGKAFARWYYLFLIISALIFCAIFVIYHYISYVQWAFLIMVPFFVGNCHRVFSNENVFELNKELKRLALYTFLLTLFLGLGLVI